MKNVFAWLKEQCSGTSNNVKGGLLKMFAILIDVLVPVIVTMTQFPIWIVQSAEATMSGTFVILCALACIPFLRQIKAWFKSPSNWGLWLIIAVFTCALDNIIHQMMIVAIWGAIANVFGAIIYNVGKRIQEKDKQHVVVETK